MESRYQKEDLQEAIRVLRSGGVILYPTDTIWGIGCDATCEEAVQRIYRIKQRQDSKAMLVLLDTPGKLQGYVSEVPDAASQLLEATADQSDARPLTIIYPAAHHLAPSLIAEDQSIGIRITSEIFSKTLCQMLKHPIVSTSANISGQPAPKNFGEISDAIRQQVDYVCLYRRDDTQPHKPSSIIKVEADNRFTIIRP